jgi:hypothetical protein
MKLLATILRMFGRDEPDRAVIDVSTYRESVRRMDEDLRELARSQERVAGAVRAWAFDCIGRRDKARCRPGCRGIAKNSSNRG